MEHLTFTINSAGNPATFRYDTLEGREHLVVPTVMLTEGVFSGSDGPIYYPSKVLGADPLTWNHMPVVVYHPEQDGKNVSARDQSVLNSQKIGVLLNTQYDEKSTKLKTETWIDVERANKVDGRIVEAILANQKVEVSTGVYVPRKREKGTFNGREYKQVAKHLKPDHLAVLPDMTGACSIADGAGLLANERTKSHTPVGNGMSLDERVCAVRDAVYNAVLAHDKDNPIGYVLDVYESFTVYRSANKLYKQDYTVANGAVALSGSPVEVVRVVQYRTADGSLVGNASGEFVSNLEARIMDKKGKVDFLINAEQSVWVESDRTDLMNWPEDRLDRLVKEVKGRVKEETPTGNKTAVVTPKEETKPVPVANTTPVETPKSLTWNDMVNNADPTTREMLAEMAQVYNAEKAKLIDVIVNAKGNTFTKEQLAAMKPDQLRGIAALVPTANATVPAPLFLGQATPPPTANAVEIPVLGLPVVDFTQK